MKKSKKVILIISIVLTFILLAYLSFKMYLIKYTEKVIESQDEYKVIIDKFSNMDKLTIYKTDKTDIDYYKFKNIKIENFLDNYFIMYGKYEPDSFSKEYIRYQLLGENDKIIAIFSLGVDVNITDVFFEELEKHDEIYIKMGTKKIKQLFKKENITNDIEVLDYLVRESKKKYTIFDSIGSIFSNFLLRQFAINNLNTEYDYKLLDGDFKGISSQAGIYKNVSIIEDDKNYFFTFMGSDIFNEEFIKEKISTVVIE